MVMGDARTPAATDGWAFEWPSRAAGHSVRWDIQRYSLVGSRRASDPGLVILEGLQGELLPGETLAILGPSGAGKTTFLSLLAGRVQEGRFKGQIFVGNEMFSPTRMRSLSAYVEQEDHLVGCLTVHEELSFAADLRLDASIPAYERRLEVEKVKGDLGLTHVSSRRIGDYFSRGISGGEKRRVSIAKEMVTHRQILFLDEPTSGLDSFTALQVVHSVIHLARRRNLVVFCTIHQPSSELLHSFDKVLLLAGGRTVYFGGTRGLSVFFRELGYEPPQDVPVSDFVLSVIHRDFPSRPLQSPVKPPSQPSASPASLSVPPCPIRTDSKDQLLLRANRLLRTWRRRERNRSLPSLQALHSPVTPPDEESGIGIIMTGRSESSLSFTAVSPRHPLAADGSPFGGSMRSFFLGNEGDSDSGEGEVKRGAYPTGYGRQVAVQMRRFAIIFRRDPVAFFVRFFLEMLVKLMLAFEWWRIGARKELQAVGDLKGAMLFTLVATGFAALMSLPQIEQERRIFVAEQRARLYRPTTYIVATLAVTD